MHMQTPLTELSRFYIDKHTQAHMHVHTQTYTCMHTGQYEIGEDIGRIGVKG